MTQEDFKRSMDPVKVVIVGDSNSGKSTLINALCGNFVVPECSHTSTLVTTYIGRIKDCPFECAVINRRGRLSTMTLDEFQTNIVYGHTGIYDDVKSKFVSQTAFINMAHSLSSSDMLLVDTIGTGINAFDTKRTAAVVRKSDIVLYVHDASRSYNLLESEVLFLKHVLFPQGRRLPVSCKRIFIIANKIDNVVSMTELVKTMKFSLEQFFPKSSKNYRTLCDNIILISSLYFRLATAGVLKKGCGAGEMMTEERTILKETRDFETGIRRRHGKGLLGESNADTLIKALIRAREGIKSK